MNYSHSKKEEGRRKKEEGRRKTEDGRRKKEDGRRKKEEKIQDHPFIEPYLLVTRQSLVTSKSA
jgi:hypothetical protein